MKKRNYKSRSLRRIQKKTPGNEVNIHYRRKNPKGTFCGISGQKLNGIGRNRPGIHKTLSKSKKRPNRKFGGTLSHKVVKMKLEIQIWRNTESNIQK